jgi:hypothetical protein
MYADLVTLCDLFKTGRRTQADFAVHAKVYSNLRKAVLPILAYTYSG